MKNCLNFFFQKFSIQNFWEKKISSSDETKYFFYFNAGNPFNVYLQLFAATGIDYNFCGRNCARC